MNRRIFRSVPAKKRGPVAVLAAAVAAAVSLAVAGYAGSAASAPLPPGRMGRALPLGWGSSAACCRGIT